MAVAEPAGTVIVNAGTGSSALLPDSETIVPPAGLSPLNVTLQLVLPDEPKLVGLQANEVSVGPKKAGPVTIPPAPETVNE